MKNLKKVSSAWRYALFIGAMLGQVATASGQDRTVGRSVDDPEIQALRLDTPTYATGVDPSITLQVLDPSLIGAKGQQQIIVRLKSPATSEKDNDNTRTRRKNKFSLESEQDRFLARCSASGFRFRVLGRVQHVLNAVFLEVPASALAAIALDPDVMRVAPVSNYQLDLSETVPYIGAAAVQAGGRR